MRHDGEPDLDPDAEKRHVEKTLRWQRADEVRANWTPEQYAQEAERLKIEIENFKVTRIASQVWTPGPIMRAVRNSLAA